MASVSGPRIVRDRALIPSRPHSDMQHRAPDRGRDDHSGLLPLKPLPSPPPKAGALLNTKA